jgi:predicted dehydrogenase
MPSPSISHRPRVALIGVSGYGRTYYNLLIELHALGEILLTAVAIIDPENEKAVVAELASIGCEVFGDFRLMLERHRGRLELCAIPTGIPWHTPMTLAALEAGANVLVEKPLAATLEEVDVIRAAEEKHARLVMLGFQYHYTVENIDLKRALLASEIGALRSIRVIGLWPRGAEYYSRTDWAGRIQSGKSWVLDSPISNAFAHHLSLALFFAGSELERSAAPDRVSAELYRAQPIENFDTAALRIETDTGVAIHFYASHSCTSNFDPEVIIEGTAGRVIWRHGADYTVEPLGAARRRVPLGDEQSARLRMFRNALGRLQDKNVFVCGTAIAREHTRCIQAAQRSGPVRDVPKEWVETNGEPGLRRQTWIVGVEETMRRAFEQARSLGEIACPWASPQMEIAVADFDRSGVRGASVPSANLNAITPHE